MQANITMKFTFLETSGIVQLVMSASSGKYKVVGCGSSIVPVVLSEDAR